MARGRTRTEGFSGMKARMVLQAKRLHDRVTDRGVHIAKRTAPKETGRLSKSVRVLRRGSKTNFYGSGLYYARQREKGGTIRARRKPHLVFFWKRKNRWFKGKRVRQKGSHFLKKSSVILQAEVHKISKRYFKG